MTKISSSYEVVIRPKQPWLYFDWRGLVQYRDLFFEMVRRDFSARYKQTILGPAWFVINPLITTAMMVVIFSKVLGVPTDGVHPFLFFLGGQLSWAYFAQILGNTGNTLAGNAHIFGKVYFPRLIVPLSVVASSLISFAIQLTLFVIVYVFLVLTNGSVTSRPTLWLFAMPLVILHTALLALGVGLILSSISAKYKDFGHLTGYLMQLWVYVTPLMYPLSKIPEKWQWVAVVNPLTCIVEAFRAMLLGTPGVSTGQYGVSVAITVVLSVAGLLMFQRTARTFIDYV
ncbi:MAG TPA: ABC transporter permease [Opitutaceae bacterium]|nr:ABC transporter permease [Opitutaceae bacterium]